MTAIYTVYCQPGCSYSLYAKEFLTSNDINYESVNVRERDNAMETLTNLGVHSFPVVTKDKDFIFAQDIDVLAAFGGIESSTGEMHINLKSKWILDK